MREPFSYDWFDYDVALDVAAPGAYGRTDFDNRGPTGANTVANGFLYAHAGAQLQFGEFGLVATSEFFQYSQSPTVSPTGGRPGVTLVYGRYHALAGYGLADDQFVFGAGARIITLQVQSAGDTLAGVAEGQTLLTLDGAGPEAGLVWKPNAYPFRVGTTFRSAVGATVAGFAGQVGGFLGESFGQGTSVGSTGSAATASGDVCPAGRERAGVCRGFILPATATVPWELETGFAVQLGPRPMNPPWLNARAMERPVRDRIAKTRAARQAEYTRELAGVLPAERAMRQRAQEANEESLRGIEDQEIAAESARLRAIRKARYANWPRERITIMGSLLVTGPSANAVSLEGFASQTLDTVGQSVSFSPRIGIESEPIPNWLDLRVGSYIEPSRFATGTARQHFTAGFDVRLLPFSPWGIFGEDRVWRLSIAADLAPRYQNYGLGLGAWY